MSVLNIPAALSVARKDIKILLNDRGTLALLFVIPILFILAFSGITGGGSDPQEEAITLPVVNLDAGSEALSTLLDALNQSGGAPGHAGGIHHQKHRQIEPFGHLGRGTGLAAAVVAVKEAHDALHHGDIGLPGSS